MPKDLQVFSLSLRSAAGRGQGERGLFLTDLKAPPLPDPLLHFAEEREKTLSHIIPPLSQFNCCVAHAAALCTRLNNYRKRLPSMKSKLFLAYSLFSALLLSTASQAAEGHWPQFRGPNRNDVSTDSGLLKQWPEAGPASVWIFKTAGQGYSGPAIVGGKLFTMGSREGKEQLLAIDAESAKELWSAEIGGVYNNNYGGGPRATPTVDGALVYGMGGQGALICAQVEDGKVVWKKTMQELGGTIPGWGFAESVLIDGARLICTPGGKDGTLAALDKKTGKVLWQSQDWTDPAQYASTIVAEPGGVRQYIQLTMKHLAGVAAADGKLLWQSSWPGRTAVIPTPIFRDGYVYVSAGYNAGCKLVQITGAKEPVEVYANKTMDNKNGGVVLVGDYLYGYAEQGGWLCQKFKTGEEVWKERGKLGKGSLTSADGMLYCLAEDNGTAALVEASPDGWKEHGRFKLDPQSTQRGPQGKVFTHPVVTGGRLYLRDQEFIFCYDVRDKAGKGASAP